MEDLKKLIQEIIDGIGAGIERFTIVDSLHIHDTHSGLKFHMYDVPEPFHITIFETGEEIAHMKDFIEMPEIMSLFGKLKDKLVEVYKAETAAKKIKSQTNRTNLVSIYNRKI